MFLVFSMRFFVAFMFWIEDATAVLKEGYHSNTQ